MTSHKNTHTHTYGQYHATCYVEKSSTTYRDHIGNQLIGEPLDIGGPAAGWHIGQSHRRLQGIVMNASG